MAHEPETLATALPDEILELSERVLQAAKDRELTIATAESCTGGLLAAILTDVSGCGRVFERAFVVYTNEAKSEMLGIDPDLIEEHGAVSREAALAMVEGALANSRADIALSVTGFAGPGDDEDEEGLVHLACCRRGRGVAHVEEHYGAQGRAGVRKAAIETALKLLKDAIAG